MHGIIIEATVEPSRHEEARKMLLDMIVPRARARPGFMVGFWLRAIEGDALRAVQIYDSEDNAKAAAEKIRTEGPPPGAPVTLESVNVYEVVAHTIGENSHG